MKEPTHLRFLSTLLLEGEGEAWEAEDPPLPTAEEGEGKEEEEALEEDEEVTALIVRGSNKAELSTPSPKLRGPVGLGGCW